MDKYDFEERYKKWCQGRTINHKKIIDIKLYGPPSFVYGVVTVILEDDSEFNIIPLSREAFKPRKKDFEYYFDEKEE